MEIVKEYKDRVDAFTAALAIEGIQYEVVQHFDGLMVCMPNYKHKFCDVVLDSQSYGHENLNFEYCSAKWYETVASENIEGNLTFDEALQRFKNKMFEMNKWLIGRYPFLAPRDFSGKVREDYDYTYTMLDCLPKGWYNNFGFEICEDIRNALVEAQSKDPLGGYEDWDRPDAKKISYLDGYHIVQIKEKFGCYDEKTEVLTKNGWKFFKDVTLEDEFATLDSDGETLIYQKPTDIINEKYEGDMYHLSFRGVDLLVTPNHKLYVAKGSYYNGSKNNQKRKYDFELLTPDVYFRQDKRFKKGCNWIGNEPNAIFKIPGFIRTDLMHKKNGGVYTRTYSYPDFCCDIHSFLRFLGFYVAEGYTDIKRKSIYIAYNYNDEEELVTGLIDDIGFQAKQGKGVKYICSTTLAHWLYDNCYINSERHIAATKKVPNFIKDLPPKYIEEFLEYLFIGDGHKAETSNILTTTSKYLADDVCELLLKAEYTFSMGSREPRSSKNKLFAIQGKNTTYDINWLRLTDAETDMSKATKNKSFTEEWTGYAGQVYCVTIPNHILYVRRNGKGVWCGNSLRWYDNGAPEEVDKVITKYENLSFEICIRCGKPALYETSGWISFICEDCAEKLKPGNCVRRKIEGGMLV